ncbi:Oxysterol-binding protein [Fomitopsis serialis]|uniref:Oxysterol-binding protein n=1 Tax=Fomitopsis serialis TaxID=139415 RepID=UPI00200799E4|nr:Oxysterol-binding protein [Neoantrodia serialis]KAH9921300.1 Oxysterol-binding protein [Neoantrodia serialis]
MMGLFNQATQKVHRPRGSSDDKGSPEAEATDSDDVSILDEEEGSIIKSMISQLRVGMDLSKVTFPTFVLEPRSMLERITDFMSHPDLVFGAEQEDDPEERFIRVLQYYLAGWHIKPKGVKKPYNPVLGEFFRCRYDYPDGSQGFYIAEQVSHHPPVSAFFYVTPANKVCIVGELRPKSKFLGNSVSTQMDGENRVYLMDRPTDGPYVISMPNMYARGILWGKMVLELGDTCTARNDRNGYTAEIQFKTKGYFSGTYNAIQGKIRAGAQEAGEVTGKWSETMEYQSRKVRVGTGQKRILFDAQKDGDKVAPKWVAPEDDQEPNESRRLWQNLTEAILAKDMNAATEAKTAVEESQRELRRRRDESGQQFVPRFFSQDKDGRWVPKINLPEDPQEAVEAVKAWIWAAPPGQR